MKQITKTVQEIGNGAHIYMPKEMIGKKVVITVKEKSIEDIETEVITILRPYLKHIKGIYLHGSYARNEQTMESDIDILVITDKKIKKRINEYDIISATEKQIENTIKNNAVLILPILKEAKPILNEELIEKYRKEKLTKKNTRWYIESTETSLGVAREAIEAKDEELIPNLVYPLIMRLRGLHLIVCLIYNKAYSNKQVDGYLVQNGLPLNKVKELNRIYRQNRDGKIISLHSINYNDVTKLYGLTQKYLSEVKRLWGKLN